MTWALSRPSPGCTVTIIRASGCRRPPKYTSLVAWTVLEWKTRKRRSIRWMTMSCLQGAISTKLRSIRICLCKATLCKWPIPSGVSSAVEHLSVSASRQRRKSNPKTIYNRTALLPWSAILRSEWTDEPKLLLTYRRFRRRIVNVKMSISMVILTKLYVCPETSIDDTTPLVSV